MTGIYKRAHGSTDKRVWFIFKRDDVYYVRESDDRREERISSSGAEETLRLYYMTVSWIEWGRAKKFGI